MTRIPAAVGSSGSRPAAAGQGPVSVQVGSVAAGLKEVVVQQVPTGHCN